MKKIFKLFSSRNTDRPVNMSLELQTNPHQKNKNFNVSTMNSECSPSCESSFQANQVKEAVKIPSENHLVKNGRLTGGVQNSKIEKTDEEIQTESDDCNGSRTNESIKCQDNERPSSSKSAAQNILTMQQNNSSGERPESSSPQTSSANKTSTQLKLEQLHEQQWVPMEIEDVVKRATFGRSRDEVYLEILPKPGEKLESSSRLKVIVYEKQTKKRLSSLWIMKSQLPIFRMAGIFDKYDVKICDNELIETENEEEGSDKSDIDLSVLAQEGRDKPSTSVQNSAQDSEKTVKVIEDMINKVRGYQLSRDNVMVVILPKFQINKKIPSKFNLFVIDGLHIKILAKFYITSKNLNEIRRTKIPSNYLVVILKKENFDVERNLLSIVNTIESMKNINTRPDSDKRKNSEHICKYCRSDNPKSLVNQINNLKSNRLIQIKIYNAINSIKQCYPNNKISLRINPKEGGILHNSTTLKVCAVEKSTNQHLGSFCIPRYQLQFLRCIGVFQKYDIDVVEKNIVSKKRRGTCRRRADSLKKIIETSKDVKKSPEEQKLKSKKRKALHNKCQSPGNSCKVPARSDFNGGLKSSVAKTVKPIKDDPIKSCQQIPVSLPRCAYKGEVSSEFIKFKNGKSNFACEHLSEWKGNDNKFVADVPENIISKISSPSSNTLRPETPIARFSTTTLTSENSIKFGEMKKQLTSKQEFHSEGIFEPEALDENDKRLNLKLPVSEGIISEEKSFTSQTSELTSTVMGSNKVPREPKSRIEENNEISEPYKDQDRRVAGTNFTLNNSVKIKSEKSKMDKINKYYEKFPRIEDLSDGNDYQFKKPQSKPNYQTFVPQIPKTLSEIGLHHKVLSRDNTNTDFTETPENSSLPIKVPISLSLEKYNWERLDLKEIIDNVKGSFTDSEIILLISPKEGDTIENATTFRINIIHKSRRQLLGTFYIRELHLSVLQKSKQYQSYNIVITAGSVDFNTEFHAILNHLADIGVIDVEHQPTSQSQGIEIVENEQSKIPVKEVYATGLHLRQTNSNNHCEQDIDEIFHSVEHLNLKIIAYPDYRTEHSIYILDFFNQNGHFIGSIKLYQNEILMQLQAHPNIIQNFNLITDVNEIILPNELTVLLTSAVSKLGLYYIYDCIGNLMFNLYKRIISI